MSDKTSDILIIYSSSFKLKEVNVLKKAEYAKTIKKQEIYHTCSTFVFTTKLATMMNESANLTQPFNPL